MAYEFVIIETFSLKREPPQSRNLNVENLSVMQSLVLIRKSEVPVYLQDSELYLSLDDENDDEISVPSNCFK